MENLQVILGSGKVDQAEVVELALVPVLKVVTICLVGYLLAHPRIRILTADAYKLLSKLVFVVFLPCLIFTELGALVTLQNMLDWWFIPLNVVLSSVIGCLFGYLVAVICQPPPQFFKFTIVMTGIGNTGNLPLAIVESICGITNPFGEQCKTAGVAYVAFSQWVAVITIYTFVYHMMEPPEDYYDLVASEAVNTHSSDGTTKTPLLEAEWPGVKDAEVEDSKTPLISRVFSAEFCIDAASDEEEHRNGGSPRTQVPCLAEPQVVKKMRMVAERTPLQHMLQPPILASLLAMIVGIFPHWSSFLFGEDAPLEFFTDSLSIIAGAMVPCIMLVMGGTFADGPSSSSLGIRTTVGICFTRLFVLPPVGIVVVLVADKLGFVPHGDSMFMFVLLLQHTMPSAILVGAMATLRGFAEKEAAAILLWQHIFAVISIAFYIAIYLNIIYML